MATSFPFHNKHSMLGWTCRARQWGDAKIYLATMSRKNSLYTAKAMIMPSARSWRYRWMLFITLVEDAVYERYMKALFKAASRFVIIYSDNEESSRDTLHIRHRKFSAWVEQFCPTWDLVEHIPNKFPYQPDTRRGSWAEFWIYARRATESHAGD